MMMLFQWNRYDFAMFFHLMDNEGHDGQVEFPGGGGEMEAYFQSFRQVDVHFEVIQVDPDQGFVFLDHVRLSTNLR